jgi:hypothetical protein
VSLAAALAFATAHRVEEEFGRSESRIETVLNEPLLACDVDVRSLARAHTHTHTYARSWETRVAREVRQRAIDEAVLNAHAAHLLLPDARNHLTDVNHRSL